MHCVAFISRDTGLPRCASNQLLCDGTCISGSQICDGQFDCSDYSDEENCGMAYENERDIFQQLANIDIAVG